MGVTKTDLFSDVQNDIALAAKAFAHPARVAIIQCLLEANACINGDLVREVGLAQATISQHLRELKDIGIIQGTIEGSKVNYCINPLRWAEIKAQFTALFEQFGSSSPNDCC
ncbi:MAG: metalloregulator ArsR/SmtB family transcription factor [bacterium]|jgi:predicted transcriptional regulator